VALYETPNPDVKALRGLHLYHFVFSNCSQRVRSALEEKGLAWTSHHVDLPGREHAGREYQSINPKGVVPTLVHDGQVVLESNDILVYLDEHFPEPPLRPADAEARRAVQALIDAASGIQPAIKVLSHELVFRRFRKVDAEEVAFFASHHNDKELVAFLRDYAAEDDAWKARLAKGHADMKAALTRLEVTLAQQPWLSGADFGLADISWSVNGHRLCQAGYDLAPFPKLQAWVEKVSARPAFETFNLNVRQGKG
jgi:glutathione S-transferase